MSLAPPQGGWALHLEADDGSTLVLRMAVEPMTVMVETRESGGELWRDRCERRLNDGRVAIPLRQNLLRA